MSGLTFKFAVRNILREKTYGLINIAGLSLSLACFFIIAVYLQSEMSYDQHNLNHDRIYRLSNSAGGGLDFSVAVTPSVTGPLLKQDYPAVQHSVRMSPISAQFLLRHKENAFYWDSVVMTDDNVFEVFSHEILRGDPDTALLDPLSMAISESFAKKYFGEENPLGETISSDEKDYRITLVFKDLPQNTHLPYEALISYNAIPSPSSEQIQQRLDNFSIYTYLQFSPGYEVDEFPVMYRNVLSNYLSAEAQERYLGFNPLLEPLADIHFHSETRYDYSQGNIFYLYALAAVGIFVLLVACINYTNLATALYSKRAKEVGMRKILGCGKSELIAQFLIESFLFATVSFFISLLMVTLLFQFTQLSALFDNPLAIELIDQSAIVAVTFFIALLIGLIAGLYPAFYLSSAEPSMTSKKGNASRNVFVRQGLVFIQFVVSVSVIASTLLMYSQMQYISGKSLGFEKENKLIIKVRSVNLIQRIPAWMNQQMQQPNVLGFSLVANIPGEGMGASILSNIDDTGNELRQMTHRTKVDENFIETMGVEILSGRDFDMASGTDNVKGALINQAAFRQLGWEDPLGKQFNMNNNEYSVLGVFEDYHFFDLHQQVEPLILYTRNNFDNMNEESKRNYSEELIINISGNSVTQTLSLLERAWLQFDPEHPFEFKFLDQSLDQNYRAEQTQMKLIATFAGICIFISTLGLFGLAAFTTAQRTKEIGVRKVLGASASQIIFMLFKKLLGLVTVASIVASVLSYFVINQWLSTFYYRAEINFTSFFFAAALAIGIAFITVATQSGKTALANPIDSLRYE